MPPFGFSAFPSGWMTCWPRFSLADRASWPMVRPVTVAARQLASGRPWEAAATYEGIGAATAAAQARLAAARAFVEAGRRAEADAELKRALAFWRSVEATRYVREAESLGGQQESGAEESAESHSVATGGDALLQIALEEELESLFSDLELPVH